MKFEAITRRQVLTLGALAAGSMLVPAFAYADSEFVEEAASQSCPITRATLMTKDGELLASTSESDSLLRSASSGFELRENIENTVNADGSITVAYSVEVIEKSKGRIGTYDDSVIYYIEFVPTYYILDGNIRITKVKGSATKKVSYASFQGSKALVAHQGLAGSAKCHAECLFTSDSKTMETGFDAIPYVKSSDSNGMVVNGGECTATLYISGMGETILRAEYLI